jgi:FkbM family methyltransferase
MEKDIKQNLIDQFIQQVGYTPDIDNPKTYNEKIQWLKLYYHDPLMTICTDKYAVREYVSKVIGEKYLVPLIGVYNNVKEIDFNSLPEEFVFKLNNGSGEIIICKDKRQLDLKAVKATLEKWLKPESNHYYYSYEWAYKNIKSKILCEKYLNAGKDLLDYKILCFNGKAKIINVCSERNAILKFDFFDLEWNKLPFIKVHPKSAENLKEPAGLKKMIKLAEKFSGDFPFVRVDFYEIENKIYFGELTFYPGNGMDPLEPAEWDYRLGSYLSLPAPKLPVGKHLAMTLPLKSFASYEHRDSTYTSRIVCNNVKKCDLFIDIGADYGYYSLLAADANNAIKIFALEPIEENFNILNKNLILNNIGQERAKWFKAALSSGPGKKNLYKSETSEFSSFIPNPISNAIERIEVDALNMDEILVNEQFKSLFLKIEINGNELEVLEGLKSTFNKCDDITMLFLINPEMFNLAGTSLEEMIDYLQSRDFKLFGIDDKAFRYYPLDLPGNLEMMMMTGINKKTYFNILCIKKSKSLSVLFFSHDSGLSGANRTLLDLQAGLSEQGVLCTTVLPGEGVFMNMLRESGISTLTHSKLETLKSSWQWVEWPGNELDDHKEKISKVYTIVLDYIIPEIKKLSPDVIFSQTIASPWGSVCASLLGLPHAISAREYGVLDHNLNFLFGFEESLMALYKNSDVVFCITNDVRNTLFNRDFDHKTTVVYNGIQLDISDIKNDTKILGSHYNADWHSGVNVGVFGTIMKSKGQEDIIQACIELSQKGYNIKCSLVGAIVETEYYKFLNQMIITSGFPDRFIWFNFLDDPYKLMKEVDIVVSCARMEALGRTLFESILLLRPIIYVNSGGPKEVFINGMHGLSYNAGDYHGMAENILITINNIEDTQKRMLSANEYVIKKFQRKNFTSLIREKLELLKVKNHINSNRNGILDFLKKAGIETKNETLLQPKIYYSQIANRYNERQSVLTDKISFGLFSINITFPGQGHNHLRFDPVENSAIELKIYKILVTPLNGEPSDNPIEEDFSNGIKTGKWSWRFINSDPQVHFTFGFGVKTIKIIGEMKKIYHEEVINDLLKEMARKDEVIKQKNEALKQVYSSKSWYITKPLRAIGLFIHSIVNVIRKD